VAGGAVVQPAGVAQELGEGDKKKCGKKPMAGREIVVGVKHFGGKKKLREKKAEKKDIFDLRIFFLRSSCSPFFKGLLDHLWMHSLHSLPQLLFGLCRSALALCHEGHALAALRLEGHPDASGTRLLSRFRFSLFRVGSSFLRLFGVGSFLRLFGVGSFLRLSLFRMMARHVCLFM